MDDAARAQLERDARALCERGDHAAAATLAIKGYGPELFGFVYSMSPGEADAADAFAETAEALWRSLPTFAWQCSLRTWAYAIARNQMRHRRRGAARQRKRGANVGDAPLEQVAIAVRTETLPFLRTENRTRLQVLRDELPEEERMLLALRIDRRLAWNDIARVLAEGGEDEPPASVAVAKEAARLRKQFQVVKDRLRARAKKEGLIE
jgi:RNA polymerase sigma-70 factor (ECF subfamily)